MTNRTPEDVLNEVVEIERRRRAVVAQEITRQVLAARDGKVSKRALLGLDNGKRTRVLHATLFVEPKLF